MFESKPDTTFNNILPFIFKVERKLIHQKIFQHISFFTNLYSIKCLQQHPQTTGTVCLTDTVESLFEDFFCK